MSNILKILEAVQLLSSGAFGEDVQIGQPMTPSAGDNWVDLDIHGDFDLGQSGGSSDSALRISVFTIVGVTGSNSGDVETADSVFDRCMALKMALEADVHLGNLVEQVRMISIDTSTAPSSENGWESGAKIIMEVRQW